MSTATAPMTADEFLKLLDTEEQRVELIDGEVVDMPGGGPNHEAVKANLNEILVAWLLQRRVGKVHVESAYRLDDRIVQVPDLSVLGSERVKLSIEERFRGAPDLAVEVVSSETAERLQAKIRLYFKHGSKGVWSVFPVSRIVHVNHPNGHIDTLEQDQMLEDPGALPGFSAPISAIFEGL
ncbi:MAG TPA: Uma2 family endonuclease [Bryobacteraceae bacterium]|jgi:Uma2 family endonuclease|nr:Uma2 family endonuclease [Bryobacteraceae bacterium]